MQLSRDEAVILARLLGNHLCTDEAPDARSDDHKELEAVTDRLLDWCQELGEWQPLDEASLPPLKLVRFGSRFYPDRLCFEAT